MLTIRRKSKDSITDSDTWNYWSKDFGTPSNWTKLFAPARSSNSKQSPIVINNRKCIFDCLLTPDSFRFNYKKENCSLLNDGYSWCLKYEDSCKSTLFSSNPVGIYKPYEIRCHWDYSNENGSEHVIDDMCYAGELQLVQYNVKYNSYTEALEHRDGLVIFSVLLKECEDDNASLNPVISAMSQIEYKNESILLNQFDSSVFLPKQLFDYWTYEGSLTMPPCTECVTWTIFREPINISSKQLDAFGRLCAVSHEDKQFFTQKISRNVRPTQKLNGRVVRSSFRAGGFSNYSWE